MITVYIWPDGSWCDDADDLHSMLRWKSDDYEKVELTWEAYEQFVNTH